MKLRPLSIFILLIIPVLVLAFLWFQLDKEPPEIDVSPAQGFVSKNTTFTLKAADPGSGLQSLSVRASQGNQQVDLLSLSFDQPRENWDGNFTLDNPQIQDGPLSILVTATDTSRNNWNRGNSGQQELSMTLDSVPPRVTLLTSTRYMRQGGSGCVSYSLTEGPARSGVRVGEDFFPGYEHSSGKYVSFFAFPHDLEISGTPPTLVAEDVAGNEGVMTVPVTVMQGRFKKDKLTLSDRFLQLKMPQFTGQSGTQDHFQTFLYANKEIRAEDSKKIYESGMSSFGEKLWEGTFLRLPNSARRAGYGDHRFYFYQGKQVDEAYHLGIDLASTARSPVPASNTGTVTFADTLGIYGQTVIIDHGFGLQSLYSHLSEIKASVGQQIKKGQIIGLTGETGMALGDHLHFGVLISGRPVTPVEWWDAKWIQDRIAGCFQVLEEQ